MGKVGNLIGLTRWKDWILNVAFVLFGFFLAMPFFAVYPSLIVMVAVFFLVQSFGFSINDYFDAPFDKLKVSTRNPISNGLLKKREAAVFCGALGLGGILISLLFLPSLSFLFVLALYAVFYVYSAPPFRLKEKAAFDITSHGLSASFTLLASYVLVAPVDFKVILIAGASFAMSAVVCITQEIRDLAADRKSGFRTTVGILGYRKSLNLVRLLLILSILFFSAAVVLFMPVYLLLLALSAYFPLKYLFGNPLQKEFYKKSIGSWNRGIVILFVAGVLILPFYLGWL